MLNVRKSYSTHITYRYIIRCTSKESGLVPQRMPSVFLNITKDNQSDHIYKSRRRKRQAKRTENLLSYLKALSIQRNINYFEDFAGSYFKNRPKNCSNLFKPILYI